VGVNKIVTKRRGNETPGVCWKNAKRESGRNGGPPIGGKNRDGKKATVHWGNWPQVPLDSHGTNLFGRGGLRGQRKSRKNLVKDKTTQPDVDLKKRGEAQGKKGSTNRVDKRTKTARKDARGSLRQTRGGKNYACRPFAGGIGLLGRAVNENRTGKIGNRMQYQKETKK